MRAIDRNEVHTWTHPEHPEVQVDYHLWVGPLYTTDMADAADRVWDKCVMDVRGLELPKDVTPQKGVLAAIFWRGWTPSDICNEVVTIILRESRLAASERQD